MDISECITWLKILRANMNTFPEISADKKIEALTMAIRFIEQQDKIIQILDDYDLEAWEILEKIKKVVRV